MKIMSKIDKRKFLQGIFAFGFFVFYFKLCSVIIPKLSIHATITFLLICALITAIGYLFYVSEQALKANDKLNEIFQEHEKLQMMIDTTIKMQHDTIEQTMALRGTLELYDNKDMWQMVKALSNCEQATVRVSAMLATVSNSISDIAIGDTPDPYDPTSQPHQPHQPPSPLNNEDRLAIEQALAEVNPFKETIDK